eukprot:c6824_g1_i1.p1 GENE.c6824_g1_i1~~c6824_g1_i1.p1  ORF type:complete len:247 (-),score=38.92 c6824_g1_i1:40-780(-)
MTALLTLMLLAPADTRSAVLFQGDKSSANCIGCVKLQDSFTIEVWVRIEKWPENMGWVLMHGGPCSPHRCMFFGFGPGGTAIFGFIVDDLIGNVIDLRTSDVGVWIHWAVSFDSATRTRKIFRNGVQFASNFATEPYLPESDNIHFAADNTGNNPFSGSIDELRVWNTVLNPTTIQAFACFPQNIRRISASHPAAASLNARFIFKPLAMHIPNTVNLRSALIEGDAWLIVSGANDDALARACPKQS